MQNITDIAIYLRTFATELGERILASYPPLYAVDDTPSALIGKLLRRPYPAQTAAIMGLLQRWKQARSAAVIAECGTGKTLISMAAIHCHAEGKPFTALAMVPPQLVDKWAREAIRTVPWIRVFMIDGLRTPTKSTGHNGVNEVKLRNGRIVREGLRTSLTELRLRGTARTARERWNALCNTPALFIVGRDRGKLSYFWRHAYEIAQCGRYQGSVVNPESGMPVYIDVDDEEENRLLADDFKKAKLSEVLNGARRPLYSALWQADGSKIRRFAPIDFIGRYMPDFFDYAIADEVHELKGDTAQGNALGTLAACARSVTPSFLRPRKITQGKRFHDESRLEKARRIWRVNDGVPMIGQEHPSRQQEAVPRSYPAHHFALGHRGTLIYAGEDLNGGLTTVLDDGGDRHLYSNGFLQGGIGEVVGDQVRVAMVPMLYVHEFNRAMVIGVGSGQTAGVVQLFPFQRIDLVDLSPRVVEAAQTLFSDLNRNVLGNPDVRLHIADGRHYLLTHPERFSLITLEASRLWFAGEGDLYTREFYQLCSARLAQDGVLQQWVPLFDLSVQDTVILLRTVRTEFPYVAFYMGTESGMIVASRSPLRIDYRRLLEIDDRSERRRALINIGLPRSYFLLGDCVLTPEGVDRFLAQEPERRVSTDFWPHLEYSNAHFYMGNRSSKPLRLHLLGAQQFPMPEIENADSATMGEILKDAAAERQRLFRVFPPH